jgi:glucokinase
MVLGIIVGKGIGTGLITKREIFRGVNGAALEAGHSVIKLDGPLCSCGRKGCVEALASLPQMIRCYNSKTNKKVKNIDEFRQLVEQNDKLALSILDEEAYYLAILSANLANIINPSHIIIGGEISPILPYSIEKMKNLFNSQVLSTNKCELISSNLNEKSIAFGAAIMAIEKEIEEYL